MERNQTNEVPVKEQENYELKIWTASTHALTPQGAILQGQRHCCELYYQLRE
jgi:hypothetical protein